MKKRLYFFIDEQLEERLEVLTRRPGASRSAIVAEAVRVFLDRGAAPDLEGAFKVRLDKISRELGRIQRDQQIGLESLAHFIRYQLTVTAPLAEADLAAARALGQERFSVFVDQIARRLAAGRGLARDVVDRIAPEGEIGTEKAS